MKCQQNLGLAGKISFTLQSAELPLKKAYEAFTSVRKRGDIRIQKIRQHDERQLKNAASLIKNIFNKTFTGSGEKELYELLRQELSKWHEQLKSFHHKSQTGHFPGKQQIQQGLVLIADLLQQSNSFSLIQRVIEEANKLEDFAETFEDMDDFYNSQFQTWQALSKALHEQFKANRSLLEKDDKANKALHELDRIYAMPVPYDQLRHINPLITQVQQVNSQLLIEKRQQAHQQLDLRIERVQAALTDVSAPIELRNQVLHPLQLCKKRIDNTESIPQIISEQTEAETHEEDANEQINRHIESLRKKQPVIKPIDNTDSNKVAEPAVIVPAPKRTITISPADIASRINFTVIETEAQVETYLDSIRDELLKAVKAGDKVRIK
jgi:hypothetical protein